MSDDPRPDDEPAGDESSPSGGVPDDAPRSQAVRHGSIGARVPEHVRRGVFSTGVVVLQSSHEFVLDFLLRMTQPQQVATRVVLAPTVLPGFIRALEDNLGNYERKFGPSKPPKAVSSTPTPSPSPSAEQTEQAPAEPPLSGSTDVAAASPSTEQPSAEDLYDELKLPDDMLAGHYANAVMISHTPTEFCFDFLTTFFPRSAVSARVFLAAPNVPALLNSLRQSYGQFRARQGSSGPPPAGENV